ncbi:MAG: hypothetical protein IPM57_12560 [Oligoflexia bacterium]|nr:hypothetical protein [Oligoflexia bacterium]
MQRCDVTLASISGYANPVTLSASGEPTGATVTFGANPVTPDNATTVTLSTLAGADPGAYPITITGTDGVPDQGDGCGTVVGGCGSRHGDVDCSGEYGRRSIRDPTFTWNADATAVAYTVEIATDAGFTNIIYSAENQRGQPHARHLPGTQHHLLLARG